MSGPCPFCDPSPDRVFHESALVRGLWDGCPVSDGHALLVTKRHVASWFEATEEERHALAEGTTVVRRVIEDRYGSSDYNIGVNIGSAAGQTVWHLHLHVIPRRSGDVPDPRGGVRHVIPALANYLSGGVDGAVVTGEAVPLVAPAPALSSTVVGEPDDPLLPHLVEHLDRADRADLVVAFLMDSGMRCLDDALHGFLIRGGRLRLLTGDYLDVTEPRALHRLLDLADFARTGRGHEAPDTVSLRVFETAGHSFHPKSYLFHLRQAQPDASIAYVGSSNLSATALSGGIEWNYRVLSSRDRAGLDAVEQKFARLFRHPRTRDLTHGWVADYARRRRATPVPWALSGMAIERPLPPPEPTAIQREALAALDATRAEGNRAGLVVLATGLGKTFLAAFDAKRAGARRILFVAHREEILRQAQASLRRVMPEVTMGLHAGPSRSPDADVVLASIQTLGRSGQLGAFARDAFDYVIVDEFHHAAAATYRRLLTHFDPQFLLGLTATPERTDGGDLLALCGENLVYRCDLLRGISEAPDRLVPFHYFGVPDDVDYQNIPWRARRFDIEALTTAVATEKRAANALEQWRRHAGAGSPTLAFCCSQPHADFMARYFESAGVRARAIHAGATSAPRTETLLDLADGHVEVVFAVDILNEGVDIPAVRAVLMLRPTESRIVFLQQLGRGLRRHAGKTALTVVDYVGNHRSFLLKPQMLFSLGSGDTAVETLLGRFVDGRYIGTELPDGCEVTYELAAIELLRGQLRASDAAGVLTAWYDDFAERRGARPLAVEALHEGRNPRSVRRSHGSWLRFVDSRGGLDASAQAVLALEEASRFLGMLEVTAMTRSFKMVTLQALLRLDALPGSVELDRLTDEFIRIASRHARLRGDVAADLNDRTAMRAYLLRNPVSAWCSSQASAGSTRMYFRRDGETLRATFEVPGPLRSAFVDLVQEIVDWRLAAYLEERGSLSNADLRIKCKVLRNDRHPILKLPDRTRYEGIPFGELEVLVDGMPLRARFAKEFVNVLRDDTGTSNRLGDILSGWFGADAGRGGTNHFAAFERLGTTWTLRALDPGEATGLGIDRRTIAEGRWRVHADDGTELDATFTLDEHDGRVSLVIEARGGARGTSSAVNTDYTAGLDLLLHRLQGMDVAITRAMLDTARTVGLPVDQRVLHLRGDRSYPIRLALEENLGALRGALTAAQGNNPTRRIRLDISAPSLPGIAELGGMLAGNPPDRAT